jgi:hypothetical protein
MTEIDFAAYELKNPSGRQSLLKQMPPVRHVVSKYHAEMLDLFQREIQFARELRVRTDGGPVCRDDEIDYYENLYWCALFLYFIGDPADVPLMWEAKQIDMDTACGFDSQFMVGAGVDATIAYLREHAHHEIATYLEKNKTMFADLGRWEQLRIGYFYPGGANSLEP